MPITAAMLVKLVKYSEAYCVIWSWFGNKNCWLCIQNKVTCLFLARTAFRPLILCMHFPNNMTTVKFE